MSTPYVVIRNNAETLEKLSIVRTSIEYARDCLDAIFVTKMSWDHKTTLWGNEVL